MALENNSVITGAAAFIFTMLALAAGFPILAGIVAQAAKKKALGLLFACIVVKTVLWLIYLWPMGDYFIRIGLGLDGIAAAILCMQALLLSKK